MNKPGSSRETHAIVSFLAALTTLMTWCHADEPPTTSLDITKPVLCTEIRGYEDYDKRTDRSLTRDEKLLVYFRPLHYKEKKVGSKNQVHFKQEFRVRKLGRKDAQWSNKEKLEYKNTYAPPAFVYLHNLVSLKELKPGDYEYEIVLTDLIGGEKLTRTFPFTVVETKPEETEPQKEKPARDKPARFDEIGAVGTPR